MSKERLVAEVAIQTRLWQQSFDAFDEAAAARLGVNRTDLRCLDVVLAAGPLSAGALSAATKLSPAATTTAIDRLERAGLVTRTRASGDRRQVLVAGTDTARAAERDIYGPVAAAGVALLERFDHAQLATIVEFLRAAHRMQQEQTARIGPHGDTPYP